MDYGRWLNCAWMSAMRTNLSLDILICAGYLKRQQNLHCVAKYITSFSHNNLASSLIRLIYKFRLCDPRCSC